MTGHGLKDPDTAISTAGFQPSWSSNRPLKPSLKSWASEFQTLRDIGYRFEDPP